LHESPACAAVSRCPGTDLTAGRASAAAVAVTDNRLCLSIDVICVTRRYRDLDSAQLVTSVYVNEWRAARRVHRRIRGIGAALDLVTKDEPAGVTCESGKSRTSGRFHSRAIYTARTMLTQTELQCGSKTSYTHCCHNAGHAPAHIRKLQACYILALSIECVSGAWTGPVHTAVIGDVQTRFCTSSNLITIVRIHSNLTNSVVLWEHTWRHREWHTEYVGA